MLTVKIKFDRFGIEFQGQGNWDFGSEDLWFEMTDLADSDRRWLHFLLMPRSGETIHPYGVNDLSCPYAYDLVINGKEFKNFRLEAIDSSPRFWVKGDYKDGRHRLREMG